MKTLKVMSIIGLVIAAISLFSSLVYVCDNIVVGWSVILALFVIAQNIVTLVQVKRNK